MSGDLVGLLAAPTAFLIAAGSPGPATLAVAATAAAHGRGAGLTLGAGLAVSLGLWGVAAAVGLGALMAQSVWALAVMRLVGGAFLLWLAFSAARSALAPGLGALPPPAAGRLFRRGLALNAMNPKAVLAWLAVLAFGAPPGAGAAHLALLTAVCAAIGGLVYAGYAAAFGAGPVRRGYRRWRRAVDGACAALFGLAGLRLLASRAS